MTQPVENPSNGMTQKRKAKSPRARLVARIVVSAPPPSAGTRRITSRDKGDYRASYEEKLPERSPIREDKP